MNESQLAAIEALNAARTKGEWRADHEHPMFVGTCHAVVSDDFDFMVGRGREANVVANTDFIAACSVDVPAMTKEIHRCWQRIAELEAALRKIADHPEYEGLEGIMVSEMKMIAEEALLPAVPSNEALEKQEAP